MGHNCDLETVACLSSPCQNGDCFVRNWCITIAMTLWLIAVRIFRMTVFTIVTVLPDTLAWTVKSISHSLSAQTSVSNDCAIRHAYIYTLFLYSLQLKRILALITSIVSIMPLVSLSQQYLPVCWHWHSLSLLALSFVSARRERGLVLSQIRY